LLGGSEQERERVQGSPECYEKWKDLSEVVRHEASFSHAFQVIFQFGKAIKQTTH